MGSREPGSDQDENSMVLLKASSAYYSLSSLVLLS